MIDRIKKNLNGELPGVNSWAKMTVRSVKDEKDNLEILNDWLSKENLKSCLEIKKLNKQTYTQICLNTYKTNICNKSQIYSIYRINITMNKVIF